MQSLPAGGEKDFLDAEACELAALSTDHVRCAATGQRPNSVLHTLSVELMVLIGLDDKELLDRLVKEATQLLAREGRQDAITVLLATSSRLGHRALSRPSH